MTAELTLGSHKASSVRFWKHLHVIACIKGMLLRLFGSLFVSALLTMAEDISGRWSGSMSFQNANGSIQKEPFYLVIVQRGTNFTGSAGDNETSQFPFSNGAILNGDCSFTVADWKTRLSLTGTNLEGTALRERSPAMSISVHRVAGLRMEDRFSPLAYEGPERSERILRLREVVERGDKSEEEAFWKEVEKTGAPIVERIPGNDKSLLVTFLWRGDEGTRNVLLVRGKFTWMQPDNHLFSHIEGSRVWFRTLKLRRGSRFDYTLSENDPLGTRPPGTGSRKTRYDPLNPRHLPEDPKAAKEQWSSLLELPGAPEQTWYARREGVPTVTLVKHRFMSELLRNERDILIYAPPAYNKSGVPGYPLLILLDGEDPDGLVFATTTIENLMFEKRIPPIVVVRVANPSQAIRAKELACMPEFADFLAKELISFIQNNYNVTSNPQKIAIGGYSFGGLAAAYAGLRHPETFGMVLAQSGAFWWEPTSTDDAEPNWIAREFIRVPQVPVRFYMEAGIYEVDLQGKGGGILENSRHLRDVLRAKGYNITYQEFAGSHDYMNWRGSFADGLLALLGN